MELPKSLANLILIDHFLVEVSEEEEETVTKSGIVLPGSKKTPNYGTVLQTPTTIILREGTTGYSVLSLIKPGDIVFFPINISVNYIELPELPPDKKYILLNKEHIQAVVQQGENNEY